MPLKIHAEQYAGMLNYMHDPAVLQRVVSRPVLDSRYVDKPAVKPTSISLDTQSARKSYEYM
jgi:hypothetical protein